MKERRFAAAHTRVRVLAKDGYRFLIAGAVTEGYAMSDFTLPGE